MTVFFPHQPGDRVRHSFLGTGTVRDVGERYLTVLFDKGGETLLRIDTADLDPEEGYPGAVPEPEELPREIVLPDPPVFEPGVFEPGDRVEHPKFGKGIVRDVKVWEEQNALSVTVQFDIPYGSVRTILGSHLTRIAQDDPEWPGDTFTQEAGDEPDVAKYWEPFGGMTWLRQNIGEIAASRLITTCHSNPDGTPRPVPPGWPEGVYRDWPSRESGARSVEVLNEEAGDLKFVTLFPFFSAGSQHTVTLEQVRVLKNGCEACVTALLGEAEITFYDTTYLVRRAEYKAGRRYDFLLTGIAYGARPASSVPFTVKQDPEVAAWIARVQREQGQEVLPDLEPTFSMQGMASLLPAPEGDVDDYGFRGPVQSVREVEVLAEAAWLLEVTVLRFSEDVSLRILVTRRVWQGESSPKVGEDVEGSLWLQGYFWRAYSGS